jgi:hypothetical protein
VTAKQMKMPRERGVDANWMRTVAGKGQYQEVVDRGTNSYQHVITCLRVFQIVASIFTHDPQ